MRLFPNRIYKSGSSCAIFRWTLTHSGYLTRFFLFHKSGFGGIALHWLNKPDEEPWFHDHPVNMFSIVLCGWYDEEISIKDGFKGNRVRFWNYLPFYKRHRIVVTGPALTLAFYGPHRNDWGFYTDKGWVYWKEYNAERYESKATSLAVKYSDRPDAHWLSNQPPQSVPGKDLFP